MELTAFGLVWASLCLIGFFNPIKYLVSLLIISCIFQASAVVLIGDRPIGPISATEIFFIAKCFLNYNFTNQSSTFKVPKWGKWALLFFLFGTFASVVFPVLFEGVRVYPAQYGIDDNYYKGGYPLAFTPSNVVQIIILFFNLLTLSFFFKIRSYVKSKWVIDSFKVSVILTILIGFWGFASKTFAGIPFPDSFFYSGSNYGHDTLIEDRVRLTATFVEASAAGQFLAATFWGIFALREKKLKVLCVFIILTLLLTLSSSGFVGLLIGLLIYIALAGSKRFTSIATLVTISSILLYCSGIIDPITEMLMGKLSSQSGEVRTGADIFTYNLWLNTYLMGVGLGSHRTSSFLLNMLGAVGVIGVGLLTLFYVQIIKPLLKVKANNPQAFSIVMYSLTMMGTQILSAPDLSLPMFWLGLFMAANYDLQPSEIMVHKDSLQLNEPTAMQLYK